MQEHNAGSLASHECGGQYAHLCGLLWIGCDGQKAHLCGLLSDVMVNKLTCVASYQMWWSTSSLVWPPMDQMHVMVNKLTCVASMIRCDGHLLVWSLVIYVFVNYIQCCMSMSMLVIIMAPFYSQTAIFANCFRECHRLSVYCHTLSYCILFTCLYGPLKSPSRLCLAM